MEPIDLINLIGSGHVVVLNGPPSKASHLVRLTLDNGKQLVAIAPEGQLGEDDEGHEITTVETTDAFEHELAPVAKAALMDALKTLKDHDCGNPKCQAHDAVWPNEV